MKTIQSKFEFLAKTIDSHSEVINHLVVMLAAEHGYAVGLHAKIAILERNYAKAEELLAESQATKEAPKMPITAYGAIAKND